MNPPTDQLPSVDVVEEVAAVTGVSTDELPRLHSAIDPDALDVLLADGTDVLGITFEYHTCRVTVTPGEIHVEERSEG